MPISFDMTKAGNTLIYKVGGKIDAHEAPGFEKKMKDGLTGNTCSVVVDFAGVDYISSAGLGVLNAVKVILDKEKRKIILCGMNDKIKKTFDLLGFSRTFTIVSTIDEAKTKV
jgi:anti-sigma B factor antagonist